MISNGKIVNEPIQLLIVYSNNVDICQQEIISTHLIDISLLALIKCGFKDDDMIHIDLKTGTATEQWMHGNRKKKIIYINSEEQFLKIIKKTVDLYLPYVLDNDINNELNYLCIGPVFYNELNDILIIL